MLLIISRETPNRANKLRELYKSLDARDIPYIVSRKCDPAVIKRQDIRGLIIPGARFRVKPYEIQPELDLEMYYLYHFPNTPVLGICHGCQFLMTYYGGDLIPYNSYWNKNVKIELSDDPIFHCKEDTRILDVYVYFHDLPVPTTATKKAGVREIAWFSKFRDGKHHPCAFEFEKGRAFGFMFHPEATKETHAILYNFYDKVCMSSSAAASASASA